MAELKPCPFCGRRAFIKSKASPVGFSFRAYCGNEDCKVEPKTRAYFDKEQAIEAWNRRAE